MSRPGLVVTSTYEREIHTDNCPNVGNRPTDFLCEVAPGTLDDLETWIEDEEVDSYVAYLMMAPCAQALYWRERGADDEP